MKNDELKTLFKKNSDELFIYYQYRKSFVFFFLSILTFSLFKLSDESILKVQTIYFLLFLNSILSSFYKKYINDAKIVNYTSITVDFSCLLYGISEFFYAKTLFLFWLIPFWAFVFITTSKRFSLFLVIPVSLTLFLSRFLGNTIDNDYFFKSFDDFNMLFDINAFGLSIFMFSLFLGSARNKNYFQGPVEELKDKFNAALSFPLNNPFPILEYNKKDGILPKNQSSKKLLESISKHDFNLVKDMVINALNNNDFSNKTLKINNMVYQVGLGRYIDQVNIYLTDVSEIEKTQRFAIEKEQYAMAIIDAIPGFVSWVDSDFRYLGVNKKMQEFFNLSEEQFVGNKVGALNHENYERSDIKKFLEELFNSRKKMLQKELKFNYSGKDYYNIITINKYNNDQNAVLVSVDITDVKEMEKKVKEEQLKSESNAKLASFGEMAAGIAHEINNPLSVISGMIGIVKKLSTSENIDTKKLLSIINKVENSIDRINKIIKGMKNLSRDGANDPFEYALVAEIIDDAYTFFYKKCEKNNTQLRILDYPVNLGLECQIVQVSQVLVILLNNSLDAISELEEKWIEVQVTDFYNSVRISVTDSGKGIPQDLADKIFSPFFTTKAVGRGTGLGLSLAYRIIQSHSGELFIDYDSDNTKFDIIIPKIQKSIAA